MTLRVSLQRLGHRIESAVGDTTPYATAAIFPHLGREWPTIRRYLETAGRRMAQFLYE